MIGINRKLLILHCYNFNKFAKNKGMFLLQICCKLNQICFALLQIIHKLKNKMYTKKLHSYTRNIIMCYMTSYYKKEMFRH